MAVVAGDIIRTSARFKSTVSGDVVNVYHWVAGGGLNEADADVMTDIESQLSTAYARIAQQLPNQLDPYDIRHDIVEWSNGREVVIRTLGTRTWTLTTPPASNNTPAGSQLAAVVNFRTLYPKTFGRKYIGTLSYNATSNSALSATTLTNMASFAADILAEIVMTTGSLYAGTITYKVAGGDHFATFLAAVVSLYAGVQRRRRVNTGS